MVEPLQGSGIQHHAAIALHGQRKSDIAELQLEGGKAIGLGIRQAKAQRVGLGLRRGDRKGER
jgi:hypothetical protein